MYGYGGSDSLIATAHANTKQHHLYGGFGDKNTDTAILIFADENYSIKPQNAYLNGHHVMGCEIIKFVDTGNVNGTIVGRINDFKYEHGLYIEGRKIDLLNLPSDGQYTVNGETFTVRVVAYNGDHNETATLDDRTPQQWLLIETSGGGRIFYSLEAQRVDTDGIGGRVGQETHFVTNDINFDQLTDVVFDSVGDIEIAGTIGNDTLNGTNASEDIAGGAGNDTINAGNGDDVIYGGAGDDRLYGGAGDDRLYGGAGNDVLEGGAGTDTLHGGAGNDWLHLGGSSGGIQWAVGGAGDDTYYVHQHIGHAVVGLEAAGGGNDTIIFSDLSLRDFNVFADPDANWPDALIFQSKLDSTDKVHVRNISEIENWEFADGSQYTAADMFDFI